MFIFHNFSPWQVIKRVSPFHASHKARVFRESENKNMKIFTSVASTWYVEDSKIDFKNENTAHGNRLLLFYKSKIIEIEKDEYFSNNCKKYSHCSTNSKPNSAYCSSTNSHCVTFYKTLKTFESIVVTNEIVNYSKIFGNDNIFILIFWYACVLGCSC